jgi:predicted TIM-barrel fold metal-dependent hydrolase
MLIDAHIHFFKDELAAKVKNKLTTIAQIPCYTDLTEADTRAKLRDWGVDTGILLPIATKPSQQVTINDWASAMQHDGVISCGTVHPAAGDALDELERIQSLGLHGVKLHPDYQDFFVDDKSVYPVYEAISQLGLPVVFHAGYDPLSPHVCHASPQRLARVAADFPNMNIVAAHLGGVHNSTESAEYLLGKDIFMDVSMVPAYMDIETFCMFVRAHRPDRLLFGSDCPWYTPAKVMDYLDRCGLPADVMNMITHQNAAELFDITR